VRSQGQEIATGNCGIGVVTLVTLLSPFLVNIYIQKLYFLFPQPTLSLLASVQVSRPDVQDDLQAINDQQEEEIRV
jgi:hypothetical protein